MQAVTFREPIVQDAKMTLDWRTKERVTALLKTDMKYDLDAQLSWLRSCENKDNYYHWIIELSGNPIGVINIADFSLEQKSTSWGFFIGEDDYLGLGGIIPPYLYNFLFNIIGITQIKAEVLSVNASVIDLHLFHGYAISHVEKGAVSKDATIYDVIHMVLHKAQWEQKKRFHRFRAPFPIKNPSPQLREIIAEASLGSWSEA